MSDRAAKKRDADDQFARELDRKYNVLLADGCRRSEPTSKNGENEDDRVNSAMLILELLEELNPNRPKSDGGVAETVANLSTTINQLGEADCSHEQIEAVIPNLQQLGRFKIVEQIGRGGYGVVVRAYDPHLERDVAIKIPRLETALSADARTRFKREAKAAAALNHPGVVAVHETSSDQGIDFIVTELVDGDNLAVLLARGKHFSPRAAAELVADLADAVEHAHQRGVYHRDIKPSNILIERKQDALPKIADFGLASIIDQTDFTQTGAVVGTPAYMSPEQASGNKQAIGPHTDVYGLGAVLYQLLTGISPFGDRSMVETLRAIEAEDPQSPRHFNASIPRDLEAICLKCLEKKPAARYETAQGLQADLRRFLNNSPVQARRITRLDRVVRWAGRNPMLAVLATALLCALSIGLVVTTFLWRTSESHRHAAERNQTRLEQKAEQLEGVVDSMFDRIRQLPELGLHGLDPVREKMLTDVNSYYVALLSETPSDPALIQKQADTMLRLAAIKSSLSDNQGAIDVASQLLASIPTEATPYQAQQRIDALMLMAVEHATLRQSAQQQQCYDDALMSARSAFASVSVPDNNDLIEFAKSLSEAADVMGLWGDRTTSNELALESIRVWEGISDEELTDDAAIIALSRSYLIAARAHAASEDREAARVYAQNSIDLIENLPDGELRNTPQSQFLLAEAYYLYGVSFRTELANAIPPLDQALQIASSLAETHSLVPKYRQRIGAINYDRGLSHYVAFLIDTSSLDRNEHLTTALPIFNDNIDYLSAQRAQFPNNAKLFEPRLTSSLTMKGIIFGELKEFQNQIETLEQALELARQIDDESNSPQTRLRVLGIIGNIGYPFMKQNKYHQAIEQFESAIDGLESTLQDDPDNGSAARFLTGDYEFLAKCLTALDRDVEALVAYQKSMQAYREGSPNTMKAMEAVYLVRTGAMEEAQTRYQQFKTHQIEQTSFIKLVGHSSRLISAIDELSESDRTESAQLLKLDAANTAVNALRDLQADAEFGEAKLDNLLNEPELAALKTTSAFQIWSSER